MYSWNLQPSLTNFSLCFPVLGRFGQGNSIKEMHTIQYKDPVMQIIMKCNIKMKVLSQFFLLESTWRNKPFKYILSKSMKLCKDKGTSQYKHVY